MPDVYNRAVAFGDAVSADGARITFDDFAIGFLVQRLALAYQQSISRIFEISSNLQYYLVGRPQGNIGLSRIVGPRQATTTFVEKFGDACNAGRNTLSLKAAAGCTPNNSGKSAEGLAYTCGNVVLTNISVGVEAQMMMITEDFAAMFVGLEAGTG